MTYEKRSDGKTDKKEGAPAQGNIRERVETLQEKVASLNETLDEVQETLRDASEVSGEAVDRE
jgi:uncharacterized protein YceH (UPF0502 family)